MKETSSSPAAGSASNSALCIRNRVLPLITPYQTAATFIGMSIRSDLVACLPPWTMSWQYQTSLYTAQEPVRQQLHEWDKVLSETPDSLSVNRVRAWVLSPPTVEETPWLHSVKHVNLRSTPHFLSLVLGGKALLVTEKRQGSMRMWADMHTLFIKTWEKPLQSSSYCGVATSSSLDIKSMVPWVSMSKCMCESHNGGQASRSPAEYTALPLLMCYNKNLWSWREWRSRAGISIWLSVLRKLATWTQC